MAESKKSSTSARPSSSRRSKSTKATAAKKTSARTKSSRSATKAARPAAQSGNGGSRSGNGSATDRVEAVRDTVQDKAMSAGKTVGHAAGKAKLPLVAGGAAIAGVAGGMALGAMRRGRRGGIGSALHKPKLKVDSGDVARVAKEVGSFSTQVGALAGELQRNREAAGNGRHRSPIEVALQGLTSRR
ncbi:MAG TPA: hypothetical protein VN671_06585 [Solirubrobacterales bacterium]|nr:hypothetical protein [Solirubrobacterales bacterium]